MNDQVCIGGPMSSNEHPFAKLPLKAFWVFLSGKEMFGRRRFIVPNNLTMMLVPILWLMAGYAGIYWFLKDGAYATIVLVVSQILIVGGARYMVGTNIHMMAHGLLFKSKKQNAIWGEILTTIFFIQSYSRYRVDHLQHHGKVFGTLEDGDARSIVQLGFVPEKTPLQQWLHLSKLCVDPLFHFNFFKGRVKENLLLCSNRRKLLSVLWIAILSYIAIVFGIEVVFIGYILPIIILCQISALLQLVCEHIWISTEFTTKECHLKLTNGRYCGVPLPKYGGRPLSYSIDLMFWFMRAVLIELPARIAVLQGTLPSHDWHHRFGGSRKWADCAMLKELDIQRSMEKNGESNYHEVWGFIEILDNVFVNISKSSPYPEMLDLTLSANLDYGDIK